MHENEKLVTIAEFESGFEAELAKVSLDNASIESVVFGEDIGTIKPYSTTPFNVELQVFEKDAEQAKRILAEQHPLEEDEDTGDESDQ